MAMPGMDRETGSCRSRADGVDGILLVNSMLTFAFPGWPGLCVFQIKMRGLPCGHVMPDVREPSILYGVEYFASRYHLRGYGEESGLFSLISENDYAMLH